MDDVLIFFPMAVITASNIGSTCQNTPAFAFASVHSYCTYIYVYFPKFFNSIIINRTNDIFPLSSQLPPCCDNAIHHTSAWSVVVVSLFSSHYGFFCLFVLFCVLYYFCLLFLTAMATRTTTLARTLVAMAAFSPFTQSGTRTLLFCRPLAAEICQ